MNRARSSLHQPELVLNGTATPGGTISITTRGAEATDDGARMFVFLSETGSGIATGGIPVPDFSGRTMGLDLDVLTLLGLTTLGPLLLTSPLVNGTADTPAFPLPNVPLPPIWAAGSRCPTGARVSGR